MNDYTPSSYKKAARLQALVCGFLFTVFSFVYLFVLQSDLLEALHFSLAQGKTLFFPMGSAVTITVVLLLLRWGTNCLLKLKGEIRAWAYFPSCLILGVLTDIGRGVYLHDYTSMWIWGLPLLLAVYFAATYWGYRWLPLQKLADISPLTLLNSNLIILFLLCLMTVLVGNSNRAFHHELQAERFLRNRQYGEVLKVGERSQEVTRTLSALRAMAMAREGTMGEKLFAFPQYYRADGLFFEDDSLKHLRFTNDSIYYLLGVRPYAGEDRLLFLRNICYKGTGKYTAADYYLSALLLNKRIDEFASAIHDLYDREESLPRYYREALVMYEAAHPSDTIPVKDSLMIQRFAAFNERRTQFSFPSEERKEMQREYGDTYWWYYHYRK